MKRLTALLLALLLLAGCSPAPEPAAWYSFTDSTGATVTLPQKPKTVAVLFSSFAEVWVLAGGQVSVTVGETVERGFAASPVLVDSGAGKTIDLEALIAAKPDLVIGSADIPAQAEACRAMASCGIPAAQFRVDTFADYLAMLKICTDITENAPAYETHGLQVQQKIQEILSTPRASAPSILFVRCGSTAAATKAKRAPENFVCTMLQQLGAHNIADDAPVLLDGLSLEYVIARDPQVIFLSPMGNEAAAKDYIVELFSQPGWAELTAVKEENYHFLSKELFHFKPNARWAEAYEQLETLLYPE